MLARTATCLDANAGAPFSQGAAGAVDLFLRDCGARGLAQDTGLAAGNFGSPARDARAKVFIPNASSPHAWGRRAKSALRQARTQVASSWGASPDDVVFVSSGTEAAQTAIRSELEPRLLAAQRPHCRTHWILGAGDHDAHQQMATWVQARGGSVSRAPLLPTGEMDLARLEALLRPETALVSLVWVNNETGVVTDVAAVARLCRARGVPLHLDAAQAWGKLPLDLPTCGAQWVSFSGHKIGALPGIGALWRGPGAAALEPLVLGKQERGSRGGTENLLGAISLGGAAASLDPVAWAERVSVSRDALEQRILVEIPGATVYGARAARRVANTSFLGFDGVEKAGLVAALDLTGYGVSSGSACQSGMTEPSHVLVAMGVGEGPARAAVRVSLDDSLELSEADAFVAALAKAVAQARG